MTQPEKSPASKRVSGVTPKPTPEIEVGFSQHLPFVTPYKDVFEMLRSEEITVKQLVAMRKSDGQARALYRLITLPIRAALKTATFVPENHIEGGEDEAAFMEQMFTLPASAGGMVVPFQRVIAQMLMAVFDGFAAFEMVYWSPKDGPLKGKWTLKKMAHRPSQTLTFLVDDKSEFAGMRQQTVFQGRTIDVRLPKDHTVYYAANEEERPFYGQSYFQSAFYHWDKKFKLYVIAHIAAQRAAVGTRVGTLPKNPTLEDKNAFKRALADLGVAQYMTIPEDFKVEALRESPGFDFLQYINHHNSQMSKSVLASFFDKEQGGGDSGKLVDFGTQSDALFMMMLQTIMAEVEEVFNQHVIPRFIDWNFGSGKYPKFVFGSLTEEQKSAIVELFKTVATAGQSLTISPEFVHEMEKQVAEEFGLEIDYEAVEERMKQEAEMAQQQQELAMQGDDPNADPAAAGDPAAAPPAAGAHPIIDPSLLPPGFTLSNSDGGELALTDLASDLLSEALELTRGKAREGFKRVQTPEGARIYGEPIGTPITREMRDRTAKHGVKGKPYGDGKKVPPKKASQKLGGGPGAKAQDLGGIVTDPTAQLKPHRILTNPKQPGAELLDYGDGTVAVRDAHGHTSPRQRFDIQAFLKFGWQVEKGSGSSQSPSEAKPKATDKPK